MQHFTLSLEFSLDSMTDFHGSSGGFNGMVLVAVLNTTTKPFRVWHCPTNGSRLNIRTVVNVQRLRQVHQL